MNAVVLTLLLPVLAADGGPAGVQLLRPGGWHGDEVDAESGDGWWGLYPIAEGFELRSTAIEVTREHDAVVDNEGEATGKRVSAPGTPPPLFLVKGIEGLSEGPVDTAFRGDNGFKIIYPGENFNVSLKPGKWQMSLSAFGAVKDEEPRNFFAENYVIHVNGSGKKQEIYRQEAVGDGVPTLIWAGDLDRDGQPDLYMDLTDHYNVTKLTLFLSSRAADREVLRMVVQWVTTGC